MDNHRRPDQYSLSPLAERLWRYLGWATWLIVVALLAVNLGG